MDANGIRSVFCTKKEIELKILFARLSTKS